MLIDWFTVGAQVLNFLILVWLLKHFLYKPILNAIDAREKRIAAELADADAKKTEAQKERDDFQNKNKVFDEQRSALLSKAADEAKVERERLLDEARKAAESLRAAQATTLRNDQKRLGSAITHLASMKSLESRERLSQTSPRSVSKNAWERCSRAACAKWMGRARACSVQPSSHRLNRPSCGAPLIWVPLRRPRFKMRSTKPSRRKSVSGSRPRRT